MPDGSYPVRKIDGPTDDFVSIAGESLLCAEPKTWQAFIQRVGRENLRGVYDGDRLAGGMAFYRAAHWFGGREIQCGGFSAVAINAADRGSGACATLLRSVLEELHDEKAPLASLYASTQRLYRSVGFEHAGTQSHYSIPISSISSSDRSLPVHRFESPPLEKMNEVAKVRARRTNGNLSRTEGLWLRLLEPNDGRCTYTYLLGDLDAPEGFAIFKGATRDGGVPAPLVSTDVAANSPRAMHRLLALVRDHRSVCDSFEWFGPPNDPLIFLAEEQWVRLKGWMRWMLRIVDLPSALSQRGYSDSVSGTLQLEIEDVVLPGNAGRWQVRISGGRAEVDRGGSGALRMNIRALAPLFSAYYSAEQLCRMGWIESNDDQQLSLATAALAGDAPWLPELY